MSIAMARLALVLAGCAATASAFAPADMAGLRLKSAAAVSRRPAATAPKMALEGIEGAAQLFAVAQNVPFVDEVTGEAQGFTAPVNHFASVSFSLHALPLYRATAFRAQRPMTHMSGFVPRWMCQNGDGRWSSSSRSMHFCNGHSSMQP